MEKEKLCFSFTITKDHVREIEKCLICRLSYIQRENVDKKNDVLNKEEEELNKMLDFFSEVCREKNRS